MRMDKGTRMCLSVFSEDVTGFSGIGGSSEQAGDTLPVYAHVMSCTFRYLSLRGAFTNEYTGDVVSAH